MRPCPIFSLAAAMALTSFGACAAPAAHSASADTTSAPARTVLIGTPLKLDARRLMAMKPGEKVDIVFPAIGRKTVVFEGAIQGLNGVAYWHGRLSGNPLDRVLLKRQREGFTGSVRLGGRQHAFAQQPDGRLSAIASLPLATSQAYRLTASGQPGVSELQGNFANLAQAQIGSEITLPLPGGRNEVVVITKSAPDAQGFYQIEGISRQDGRSYPSLLTIGTEGVFGTVLSSQGEFQIVTRAGKTQIIDPASAGWRQVRGNDQSMRPHSGTMAGQTGLPATATSTTPTPIPLAAGSVDTTINLLVSYGPSYVAQWGSEKMARTRLSNIVQVANSAYANSGTGIRFNIAGWALLQQGQATPETNLPAMAAGTGGYAELAAKKKAVGAAITVFFSPFNAATGSTQTCGLAYVPGSGSGGLTAYAAQAPTSLYAVLNDGEWNANYCETLTLAHELGHTLGAVHDKTNSSFTGTFPYSYGNGIPGVFGTVMSYISPRVALFSSPRLSCAANQACGSDAENVVATMLQTKSHAARQGDAGAPAVVGDGGAMTVVAGWLVQPSGLPYTGTAAVIPRMKSVSCETGSTGLYVCKVPRTVSSVTATVIAPGHEVTPSTGSYNVDHQGNLPVNGARFVVK